MSRVMMKYSLVIICLFFAFIGSSQSNEELESVKARLAEFEHIILNNNDIIANRKAVDQKEKLLEKYPALEKFAQNTEVTATSKLKGKFDDREYRKMANKPFESVKVDLNNKLFFFEERIKKMMDNIDAKVATGTITEQKGKEMKINLYIVKGRVQLLRSNLESAKF